MNSKKIMGQGQLTIFRIPLKKQIILMLVALMLCSLNAGALAPLWGDYLFYIGGSLEDAGVALAVLSLVGAVGTLACSAIESATPDYAKFYLVGAFVALAIFDFFYALVRNPTQLDWCLAGIAIAESFAWPAFSQIYQGFLNKKNAAFGWGAQMTFENIGYGIGALVGARVIKHFDYKILFFSMSATGMASAIFLMIALPNVKKKLRKQENARE